MDIKKIGKQWLVFDGTHVECIDNRKRPVSALHLRNSNSPSNTRTYPYSTFTKDERV